jgi:hypothetical protein
MKILIHNRPDGTKRRFKIETETAEYLPCFLLHDNVNSRRVFARPCFLPRERYDELSKTGEFTTEVTP